MKALVPIGSGDYPVLARDLHDALGLKRQYGNWWANLQKTVRLVADVDVVRLTPALSEGRGGQNKIDHALTLDVAKKIARNT